MQHELAGRVAIVTGGGNGVGAAVARALAACGARVTVNDINPDRAERVAQQIVSGGGEAIALQADVANKFQCVKLIEGTRAQWSGVDILVNAARVVPRSTILKLDEWDWNRCLEVNTKGVFFMSQLCGRVMDDSRKGGVMVNLVDAAGIREAREGRAAYCASQAAVMGFARECAREYAAYGINVHTLLRGEAEGKADHDQMAQAVIALCIGNGHSDGAPRSAAEVITES